MAQCHCSSCACHSCGEDNHNHNHEHKHTHESGRLKKILLIVGAAVFVLAIVFQLLKIPATPAVLYAAAYLLIGLDTFGELIEAFREKEFFGETTLMIVASLGAMIIGEMAEGCMVMLLFAIGEMLEVKAQSKSKKNIEQLLSLKPKFAVKLGDDGNEIKVLPEELSVGDTVVVKAGDTIPCDGEVVCGIANADTSSITGESAPCVLEVGKNVRCGYISLDGSLKIKVAAAYADNTFSKILEIISKNSERKSKSESFVTRFARVYTPIVMSMALLVMLCGSIATGNISSWIYRGLVFLATSCPCALVISVPLTFFFGIGEMSKVGLLVKGSEYVERLAGIRTVALDKTGTVTKGELCVVNAAFAEGEDENEILSLCASVESGSNHPIAAEVVRYALEKGAQLYPADDIREIPGVGMSGKVRGYSISVGNKKILSEAVRFDISEETTKVYITKDGKAAGVVELSDTVRPEAQGVIKKLHALGVKKTVMLTGDIGANAEAVASFCGIDEVHAELVPQEKAEILESIIKQTDGEVAFIGDGINDAPVLALSDIGIAVGGSGAQIAVETADAVILGSSLEAVSKGIKASKTVITRVRFNVIFAISVKLAIMLLTLLGYANMWIAVFGDVGVTLLVILNSLRKFKV